jgi:uncharacterized protein involved in type VI secretion and phage assembly
MSRVTDVGGRPVSGQQGSVVVAIVVDNVDPEELGRVKVKFPTLPGEPQSFWLRQVSPNGGAVGGVYALPEKGDEVLVAFLQGHQDYGIIIGQFWNGKTKPPTEAKDGMPGSGKTDTGGQWSKDKFNDGSSDIANNDRRLWRTRSGHLLVFDDTKGKETIQLWDGTHTLALVFDSTDKRILVSNTEGDIHIRAKQDVFVEAGRDIKVRAGQNFSGETGQKTEHKAGTEISTESGTDTKMKAGASYKVEASVNVEIKASVNVKVEGMMFAAKGSASSSVEGGGSVVVRGGMVAIN